MKKNLLFILVLVFNIVEIAYAKKENVLYANNRESFERFAGHYLKALKDSDESFIQKTLPPIYSKFRETIADRSVGEMWFPTAKEEIDYIIGGDNGKSRIISAKKTGPKTYSLVLASGPVGPETTINLFFDQGSFFKADTGDLEKLLEAWRYAQNIFEVKFYSLASSTAVNGETTEESISFDFKIKTNGLELFSGESEFLNSVGPGYSTSGSTFFVFSTIVSDPYFEITIVQGKTGKGPGKIGADIYSVPVTRKDGKVGGDLQKGKIIYSIGDSSDGLERKVKTIAPVEPGHATKFIFSLVKNR
jgi:hypothetical protein